MFLGIDGRSSIVFGLKLYERNILSNVIIKNEQYSILYILGDVKF